MQLGEICDPRKLLGIVCPAPLPLGLLGTNLLLLWSSILYRLYRQASSISVLKALTLANVRSMAALAGLYVNATIMTGTAELLVCQGLLVSEERNMC